MIKVVNFPFCNYSAVARMLRKSGYPFTDFHVDPHLLPDDVLILPGVGSFSEGMTYLDENSFIEPIQAHANSGGKIIAICLGLQLLFHSSDESPGVVGLKLLDGKVVKVPSSYTFNVPHIGWNSLLRTDNTPGFLDNYFEHSGLSVSDYYFVHSYYAVPFQEDDSIATICHPEGKLDIAFTRNNLYAFQFHPEKSGPSGYHLLNQVIKQ